MASLNKVMIIGNVGSDPEMRFTPGGDPVTSFSVATNEGYTDPEGERHEKTEWFKVVAWKRLAETCNEFLNKGTRVYVEGRQNTNKWEGEDGQPHQRTELVASRVLFLSKVESEPEAEEVVAQEVEERTQEGAEALAPEGKAPDDLPF